MALNPMLPLVEGFRSAIIGGPGLPVTLTLTAALLVLLTFVSGLWFFSKAEPLFADLL
jgi:ABC-type polysaccharide/polyol phosphate export permease